MSENNVATRQESNKVWVSGIIDDEFEYSHECYGEEFYKTKILIANILNDSVKGKRIEVGGQFRSYNEIGADNRFHLQLCVFAKSINIYQSDEEIEETNSNSIYLDGFICKPPVFRETPFGRQITDLLIAVNRDYNKSDYIPCIAWGRSALYLSDCKVGDRLQLEGRIQSREYFKRNSADSEEGEYRVAYEVSITNFLKLEAENSED